MDPQKLSDKNRPTFLYKVQDRINQAKLPTAHQDVIPHNEIVASIKQKLDILEVSTLKQLATLINRQNRKMDDVTFVFYSNGKVDPIPLSI